MRGIVGAVLLGWAVGAGAAVGASSARAEMPPLPGTTEQQAQYWRLHDQGERVAEQGREDFERSWHELRQERREQELLDAIKEED